MLNPNPIDLEIPNEAIDLWYISLNKTPLPSDTEILDQSEIAKLRRFIFEKDKNCYINTHSSMRKILACYLSVEPQSIVFTYNSYGKPGIKTTNLTAKKIFFNISHSHNIALLAVTGIGNVGVDVEYIRPEIATIELAFNTFSHAELSSLNKVARPDFPYAFYKYWTLKEAFIKGIGKGLSFPLKDFDVSIDQKYSNKLLNIKDEKVNINNWKLFNLQAPDSRKFNESERYLSAISIQTGKSFPKLNYLYHDF